ncbi:MAG: serine hydrolase, partial [Blautia sp.]|nr:serine hydrolase [Blautia sp.]
IFALPCRAEEPMVWVVENAPEKKEEAKTETESELETKGELETESELETKGEPETESTTETETKEAAKKKTKKKEKTQKKEKAKENAEEEEQKEQGETVLLLRDKTILEAFLSANPVIYLPWEDGSGCSVGLDGSCITKEGLLHAEPSLHYMKWANRGGMILSGFYYHDGSGVLQQLGEAVDLSGFSCRDGFFTDLTPMGVLGKVEARPGILVYPDLSELASSFEEKISSLSGTWAFCIKNLDTGQEVSFGEETWASASMIKLFAMEAVYARMEKAGEAYAKKWNLAPEDLQVLDGLFGLLENMVCFSDNESFNELVRLVGGGNFTAGAKEMDDYLKGHGYEDTQVVHTLHPSDSEEEGMGEENHTSPKDCVLLLSRLYDGACQGDEARLSMLRFLLMQDTLTKIPSALPEQVLVANKTGETDELQHDAALIYGKDATLALCIFSKDCPEEEAVEAIREMSQMAAEFEGI